MLTPEDFRQLALAMPGAAEHSHMGHPDFRVNGRIFATLGYPDRGWGMVKLTPDQQAEMMRDHPAMFVPAAGAWGLQGATTVRLAEVDEETLGIALTAAWKNVPAAKAARSRRGRGGRG